MSVGSRNGGQQRQNPTSAQGAGAGPEDWSALKDEVGGIAGAAMERGRTLLGSTLDSAKDQATSYVDQRKDEAAQVVADLATSLRDACREFDDRPNIRGFVDSAAGGLEQLADFDPRAQLQRDLRAWRGSGAPPPGLGRDRDDVRRLSRGAVHQEFGREHSRDGGAAPPRRRPGPRFGAGPRPRPGAAARPGAEFAGVDLCPERRLRRIAWQSHKARASSA